MARRRRDALNVFESRRGFGKSRRGRGAGLIRLLGILLLIGLAGGAVFVLWQRLTQESSATIQVLGLEGPVEGATVEGPDGPVDSDSDGIVDLALDPPIQVVVSATGYHRGTYQISVIPEVGPILLQLDPIILSGRVRASDGVGVAGAAVRLGDLATVTDDVGVFEIVRAIPGTVEISRPAWIPIAIDWDGTDEERLEATLEPFVVRGLRVFSEVAGTPSRFRALLGLADASAVNTLVFDTKEESGAVMYATSVDEALDIGAVRANYDPQGVLADAKSRGLYTITRIVTFQDNFRATARPQHAIRDVTTGDVWRNQTGLGWMDPTDPVSWEYPIALGLEACQLGFDEIQFDYVRFPSDGDVGSTEYDVPVNEVVRIETIASFLTEARSQIGAIGCAVSADIFAIVLSVQNDQGLGQKVEELSYAVDAVSPMIYPSHYGRGWLGHENPNDFPAEVVGDALESGAPRLPGGALMRPWLQAFSYTAAQVLEGVGEAEERGIGWMLWNPFSDFDLAALPEG